LLIYPNPADKFINISLNSGKSGIIRIFDITGREQKAAQLIGIQAQIDISDLPEGMYVIRLYTDKNYIDKKFVILR